MPPKKKAAPKSAAPKAAPKASKAAQTKAAEPSDDEPPPKLAKSKSNQVATAQHPAPSIAVAAYNIADDTTRIEIDVAPSRVDGEYYVSGLRDAIAPDWAPLQRAAIKIYHRTADEKQGEEVRGGPLPCGASRKVVQSYMFELPTKSPRSSGGSRTLPSQDDHQIADIQELLKKVDSRHPAAPRLEGLINNKVLERPHAITDHISQLIAAARDSKVDKSSFPVAFTVCGSGGGKTTLLTLLVTTWADTVKSVMGVSKLRFAFATFNNTCGYCDGEKRFFDRGASLGFRLFASSKGWSHADIANFCNNSKNKLYGRVPVKDYLDATVNDLAKNEGMLLLVDEIVKLQGDDDKQELPNVLYQLAVFQAECLRRNVKVVAVVTSLSSEPPTRLSTGSQWPVRAAPLPLIGAQTVLDEAFHFVEIVKRARPLENWSHEAVDRLATEFCATGGHLKSMKVVSDHYLNAVNRLDSVPLQLQLMDYSWSAAVLELSLFATPIPSSRVVANANDNSPAITVEALTYNHLVTVASCSTNTLLGHTTVVVHIPPVILRSIAAQTSSLSENQRRSLQMVMGLLGNVQLDGQYAKSFEKALVHVIALRLSMLSTLGGSFATLLPGGNGPVCLAGRDIAVQPTDRGVRTVKRLTRDMFAKETLVHGDIVLSDNPNEKAVEGYVVLELSGRLRVMFVQMKFWKESPSDNTIKQWETSIAKRATEFGLTAGDFFAAFFSTAAALPVTAENSGAWALDAVSKLFEPFGVAPMMLYAMRRCKENTLEVQN